MNRNNKLPNIGYAMHISSGKSLNLLLPDPTTLTEEEIEDIKEYLSLVMKKLDRQLERNKSSDE